MLDNLLSFLSFIIFVSAIGSFVTLKPMFKSFSKAQKIWFTILIVAVIVSYIINNAPDAIHGFIDGLSGK
ncbi:hypothetical protein [Leuconostoc pseudomesenteroides]|uniref:hypothetical protein n=1 Tax=Leuconostoc pseudomesenteroides TaxID=33968 RepID=UPI0032DEE3D3